jgi:hypothetical protein
MSEARNYPALDNGLSAEEPRPLKCLLAKGLRELHDGDINWHDVGDPEVPIVGRDCRRKLLPRKGMDFVKKITNSFRTSLTDCWQSIRFFT